MWELIGMIVGSIVLTIIVVGLMAAFSKPSYEVEEKGTPTDFYFNRKY